MKTVRQNALLLVAWAAAVWSVLQVDRQPSQGGHVCGPWGCGPPVKALVIWHAFWVMLLVPPIWTAIRYLPGRCRFLLGASGAFLGLAAMLTLAAIETAGSWPGSSSGDLWYFLARYGFSLVTSIDIPLVQLTVASLVVLLTGLWAGPRGYRPPDDPLDGFRSQRS